MTLAGNALSKQPTHVLLSEDGQRDTNMVRMRLLKANFHIFGLLPSENRRQDFFFSAPESLCCLTIYA
jgi:hypothetical protein